MQKNPGLRNTIRAMVDRAARDSARRTASTERQIEKFIGTFAPVRERTEEYKERNKASKRARLRLTREEHQAARREALGEERAAESLVNKDGGLQWCWRCGKETRRSTTRHYRHHPGCKHFHPVVPGVATGDPKWSKLALDTRYGRA